ncbi:unnamed protein product, partial [Phaeothamnion confervicola]
MPKANTIQSGRKRKAPLSALAVAIAVALPSRSSAFVPCVSIAAVGSATLAGYAIVSSPPQASWWHLARRPANCRASPKMMARGGRFRPDRGESKRQARVAQLVTAELASIIRRGHAVKTADELADHVRSKISVVDVLMSPDLRTARVLVSVYGNVLEKREAYAWLVRNARPIRGALASNLRDMKSVPELFFRQTDVGAAVDVMALIDRVSSSTGGGGVGGSDGGYGDGHGAGPTGVIDGLDFDAAFDGNDEEDDDVGF